MTAHLYSFAQWRPAAHHWLVAAALMTATVGPALAQNNQEPAAGAPAAQPSAVAPSPGFPPQPPPPPLPGPPTEKRGFLNNFGQWWDQSVADFKAKWKEQQTKLDTASKPSADAPKDAAADAASATQQAMKNAADAMRLPLSHVIEVQELCPLAGNGAADCAVAATNACKGKGFNAGQPLDVRTAEKCSASLWVSGQNPTTADCPVETVVLRVACQ